MKCTPELCSGREMYFGTPFRKNVEYARSSLSRLFGRVPGCAHVGLTRHLRPQLRRLPDGQIDGFGQVLGKVKCLTLHRSSKNEGKANRLASGSECYRSGASGAAAGAMAPATAVVVRARLTGVRLAASIGVFGTVSRFVVRIA